MFTVLNFVFEVVDVSIVVVNWNSGRLLQGLLESAGTLREEVDDFVVVDNGSVDESRDVQDRFPWVRWISLEENRGFAAAANVGISSVTTTFVLLLNPDLRLDGRVVGNLLGEALKHPKAAVFCPRLEGFSGTSQRTFQIRPLPTLKSVMTDALFLDELLGLFRTPQTKVPEPVGSEPHSIEQPAAACWLLRTEAWKALRGFDESFYPAWFEDVDFCRRLLAQGWKLLYFPSLSVAHQGGYSARRLGFAKFADVYYRNLLRYWRKHHPYSYPLVWAPVHIGRIVRKYWVPW